MFFFGEKNANNSIGRCIFIPGSAYVPGRINPMNISVHTSKYFIKNS